MNEQVDKQLMDEAIQAYVDWREECIAVSDAYKRWACAAIDDAAGAFAAYSAALDREECASDAYADLTACIAAGQGALGRLFAPTAQAPSR